MKIAPAAPQDLIAREKEGAKRIPAEQRMRSVRGVDARRVQEKLEAAKTGRFSRKSMGQGV